MQPWLGVLSDLKESKTWPLKNQLKVVSLVWLDQIKNLSPPSEW